MDVMPFEVRVTEEVLDDLRERLARTRWPDEVADAGWDYGTNLAYLRELVGYWEAGFDWRAQEERLNRFAHFRAEVDGFGVHFIHERGRGDDPMPLILTHGWPGTFFEFSKMIPLLTDPESHGGDAADAFDVIVPSAQAGGGEDAVGTNGGAGDAQEVTLEVGGDDGTRFSGVCSVDGQEKVIGGRVPARYVYRPGDDRFECEIRKEGGGVLEVVLAAGSNARSVQRTDAPKSTMNFAYSSGGLSSSVSSSSG